MSGDVGAVSWAAEDLDAIAEGQQQRTVLGVTHKQYISKCRVITRICNAMAPEAREEALELDENGETIEHIGSAHGLYRMRFPVSVRTAKRVFAALSVDDSLPKRKKAAGEQRNDANPENPGSDEHTLPGENLVTVTAQTYQNYKSALKWWHEHHDPNGKAKISYPWPPEVDREVNQQIRSYKRDVGMKKRRGIMSQKEGKAAFNLIGYTALCRYFNSIEPEGRKYT